MVTVSPPNPESRQIAGYLADFERRLSRIEAGLRTGQLGNSSLDGTGIAMYDTDGNHRGTIGFQSDGTTTITSKNPEPPPVPVAPQVAQSIACLIVSHTGNTQSGAGNPADFGHLKVYAAPASSPGERTFRGTINPVPGEFVLSGLDYVSYLVDVTAVNLGGMESLPSPTTAGTPQQVVGADIIEGALEELELADGSVTEAKLAAGAVTETKIANDSISSPKIIAGSIGAAEIAAGSILAAHVVSRSLTADRIIALSLTANEIAANAITVGKIAAGAVTANTLEADMIIAKRIIAGSPTGARVEIHPTAGLQGFNSGGTRTFWVDASTGSFSATGSIQSAFSGQRVAINPGGTSPDTIRFYPSSGSTFASIDAITISGAAAIEMYSGGTGASGRRGIVIAREGFASLIHGTPDLTQIYGDIFVSGGGEGRVRSGRTDYMSDVDQHADPGERHYTCNGITPITDTTLYFRNSGFDEPELEAYWMDAAFTFSNHVAAGLNPRVYVTGANNTGRRDVYLYSLLYVGDLVKQSSRDLKENIVPAEDLDPRQAVRNARPHYFTSPHSAEEALYDTRENADGEATGELIRPAREAPTGMGLIAEDLPAEVTTMISEAVPGIDALGINTDRLITMMWQGQGDLADRLDQQVKGPKYLPEVIVLPDPPTTGAMLYVFAGSIYAVLSTGKRVKIG